MEDKKEIVTSSDFPRSFYVNPFRWVETNLRIPGGYRVPRPRKSIKIKPYISVYHNLGDKNGKS